MDHNSHWKFTHDAESQNFIVSTIHQHYSIFTNITNDQLIRKYIYFHSFIRYCRLILKKKNWAQTAFSNGNGIIIISNTNSIVYSHSHISIPFWYIKLFYTICIFDWQQQHYNIRKCMRTHIYANIFFS